MVNHNLDLLTAGATGQSVNLSSNVILNNDTVLCPNTVIEFECIGVNVEALLWRSVQVELIYSIDTGGELLTDIQPSQPPGYNFSLASFHPFISQGTRTANFTAILSVELSALTSGEQIECFRDPSLSQTINVTYFTRSKGITFVWS